MARRASSANLLKLTKTGLAAIALEPGQAERTVWDSEVQRLGYRLRASGKATWVIRPPRMGGASRIFTLGPANTLTLAEARTAARERLAKATLGDDPHAVRRQARQQAAFTVGAVVGRHIAGAEGRLRPTTVYNMKNHLNVHWKPLHGHPLSGLKRADVAARLGEIADQYGPHAANRARAVLSGFFSWAIGEGLAEANPVAGTNKAAAETARSRVLADPELAAVWKACEDDDFGRILKLLILTGQRRDEVGEMVWSELDLAGGLWSLPGERTKNRRPHDVPLSATALAILSDVPRWDGREFVFGRGSGPFSGFGHAKARLDKRTGIAVPWRIHDLRRTFATGAARLGVTIEVVERAINHTSGTFGGIVGVYQRHDYAQEKRDAMDRWAVHVEALVKA
ncbi:tyrosine-type recombinase/integrase [Methylorubrum extorquens]